MPQRSQARTNSHPSWASTAGNVTLPPTDTALVVLHSLPVVVRGHSSKLSGVGKGRMGPGRRINTAPGVESSLGHYSLSNLGKLFNLSRFPFCRG